MKRGKICSQNLERGHTASSVWDNYKLSSNITKTKMKNILERKWDSWWGFTGFTVRMFPRVSWGRNVSHVTSFKCARNKFFKMENRDLTIRQRRRPWKRRWKTDFASFHTFSRLSQFVLLIKGRGFWLELKREERAPVRTEIVEFIALPFPVPSKLKFRSFHVVVVQWRQRNVQKSMMHVQNCCFAH